MPRYLLVTHQTATSPELARRVQALLKKDPASEFAILVPATPVQHRFTWDDLETIGDARQRAEAARSMLESLGAPVVRTTLGGRVPLLAIADELRGHPDYDGIVICTLPPGISAWLKTDLPHQASRRFDLPIMHVVAQPPATARADAAEPGRPTANLPAPDLVRMLGAPRFSDRRRARQELAGRGGAEAVPALLDALRSPDEDRRWEASRVLVDLHPPEAAEPLADALEDEGGGVRWLAAEALVNIGAPAALPVLRRLLTRSGSTWMRNGAHHVLAALAREDPRSPLRPVVEALEGVDPAVGVLPEVDRALRTLEGHPMRAAS